VLRQAFGQKAGGQRSDLKGIMTCWPESQVFGSGFCSHDGHTLWLAPAYEGVFQQLLVTLRLSSGPHCSPHL
ncbi:hypothetical protein LEMLEM_LOCUS10472, partial [Lemmus lemmus]